MNVLSQSAVLYKPTAYLDQRRKALALLESRLVSAQVQTLERKKRRYVEMTAKLDAMSPLKVLTRGYSMVQLENGLVLKNRAQVHDGDKLLITVSDGKVTATVTDRKEEI